MKIYLTERSCFSLYYESSSTDFKVFSKTNPEKYYNRVSSATNDKKGYFKITSRSNSHKDSKPK